MRIRATIVAALIALGCIAGAARTAGAATLNPFRGRRAARRAELDPFRGRAGTRPRCRRIERPEARRRGRAATPALVPRHRRRPAAKACQRDEDCSEGEHLRAQRLQEDRAVDEPVPLYYREGAFKEVALVYWSRKANPGYTVVFPFYWHFYSPRPRTRSSSRRSTGTRPTAPPRAT